MFQVSARMGAALIGAVFGLAAAGPTQAANVLEKNFYLSGPRYDAALPACEAGLGTIAARFSEKEARFWNSDLQILDFVKVRQVALMPWTSGTIPRRFCTAVAMVSDGRRHAVHYSIGEDTGYAGGNWGVEFCVVGLDRNWAYNPRCKMARP